jgi:serine/threonine protein kinase
MKQICKGYGQLVQKGVIHRDLKPENILISEQCLKICDFGFAKQIATQKEVLSSIVGSPIYMAPQILKG